jgi:hypothetical protein
LPNVGPYVYDISKLKVKQRADYFEGDGGNYGNKHCFMVKFPELLGSTQKFKEFKQHTNYFKGSHGNTLLWSNSPNFWVAPKNSGNLNSTQTTSKEVMVINYVG